MEALSDRQFQVLLKEYDILLTTTRSFDTLLFQIKGWSVTVYSAATGLALLNNKPLLLLVPLISSLIFWGLDGLYKNFQFIYINRTRKVEAALNGECEIEKYGYISSEFEFLDTKIASRFKRAQGKLFVFNVMILYLAQIIFLGVLWVVVFVA